MRVCLLRASVAGSKDVGYSDIEKYTDRHTIEQRFIGEDRIKRDLNFAAAESFDVYFNLLPWEWHNGPRKALAVLATKYIEDISIPVIGLPSRILERCASDARGRILLENVAGAEATTAEWDEYACTVIELDNTPIPLSPVFCNTGTLLDPKVNPDLHSAIRKSAEDAFYTNNLHGSPWCTFTILSRSEQEPTHPVQLLEVSLMPKAIFTQSADATNPTPEACAIRESFPGGYRSFIHSSISSYFLKRNRASDISRKIAGRYDLVAAHYDAGTTGHYQELLKKIVQTYNFDGLVLDIGCGTGLLARIHGNPQNLSRFIGMDVSLEMKTECLRHGQYECVFVGPMQRLLVAYADPADHIVCFGALHYLDVNELSMVLSRAFQLARLSVTFTIDEIPDSYKEAQSLRGSGYMAGSNHLSEIESYGTPVGWRKVDRSRNMGWVSPTTGVEVYTSIFRFERAI
ncbi:hypothetical protein TWF730_008761 [Orbilia blumenaviensis]|uniref:Methyltransferase domain-containing protein n=1 Tax=Orbilia blumenaviensis TaxID=1796055 RepID=A0AAV9V4Y6_9PEZI